MKIFKNRMVLGITCIVISLIICFALTPLINMGLSKKTTVVRMKQNVLEGEQLTRSMLEEVEVGNYNMPENVFHSINEVENLYLTANVCTGDYTYLYHLNGEKQAMSITIDKFAQGLSGKLKSGDIVSVIAPDYQGSRETVIPQELRYVEVIAVTANSGYDANLEDGSEEDEKELPSTVTLLVKPEQSEILAELEAEGVIHLSLVYRGTKENTVKFIEAQDLILEELAAAREAELAAEEGAEANTEEGVSGTNYNDDTESEGDQDA